MASAHPELTMRNMDAEQSRRYELLPRKQCRRCTCDACQAARILMWQRAVLSPVQSTLRVTPARWFPLSCRTPTRSAEGPSRHRQPTKQRRGGCAGMSGGCSAAIITEREMVLLTVSAVSQHAGRATSGFGRRRSASWSCTCRGTTSGRSSATSACRPRVSKTQVRAQGRWSTPVTTRGALECRRSLSDDMMRGAA